MRTKGQIWSLDTIVAVIIFMGGLLFFYHYSSYTIITQNQQLEDLSFNAKLVSSYLISEGNPVDWNVTNVNSIGLTDGDLKLNPEKVSKFKEMSYQDSKKLLSTKYDFSINFKNQNNSFVSINNITFIGKNYSLENPDNILSMNRFVFYNSSIIRIEVILW